MYRVGWDWEHTFWILCCQLVHYRFCIYIELYPFGCFIFLFKKNERIINHCCDVQGFLGPMGTQNYPDTDNRSTIGHWYFVFLWMFFLCYFFGILKQEKFLSTIWSNHWAGQVFIFPWCQHYPNMCQSSSDKQMSFFFWLFIIS